MISSNSWTLECNFFLYYDIGAESRNKNHLRAVPRQICWLLAAEIPKAVDSFVAFYALCEKWAHVSQALPQGLRVHRGMIIIP